MGKQPVQVIIRTRPTVNFANQNINIDEGLGKVGINIPKDQSQGYVNHQQENWGFQFDKVIQNASQEVIFDITAKNIIESVIEGYSGTIFCYGQTGAGKTFTMGGSSVDYKYRGLIPRTIGKLFQDIQSRYDQTFKIKASYLEIYNEFMLDLLAPSNNISSQYSDNLTIQEDVRGGVLVKGLVMKEVANEEECLQQFFEGEVNRTICEHKLNKQSSRSHCVFTLHVESRSRVESSEKIILSKLNLVDLAGSERTKKTGSEGKSLLEAQFINRSLSFLEQVVVALSEKNRDHIPYRQSKLTNILKDSIGGNCKTIMIANIWPEQAHLEETISTLKFASRMMKVLNEASVNIHLDPAILLKNQEKEIRDLKQELAMHDTLANRGRINYDPYDPKQQYQQQLLAKQFLENDIEDIEFESLRQVKELFFQMKNLYRNLKKDIQNNNVVTDKQENNQQSQNNLQHQAKTIQNGQNQDVVGEEDNKYGFGLGKAPKNARPNNQNVESLVTIPKDQKQTMAEGKGDMMESQLSQDKNQQINENNKKLINVDRQQVYLDYKNKEGSEYSNQINENFNNLQQRKQEIKEITQQAQQIKQKIDISKEKLDKKQEFKNQEEIQKGIIDEEEFEIIKEIKQQKKDYKQLYEQIKNMKLECQMIESNIQQNKLTLLREFERFFQKKYGLSIHDLNNPDINNKDDDYNIEVDSEDQDHEAQMYRNAKKKVNMLNKARKQEKYK